MYFSKKKTYICIVYNKNMAYIITYCVTLLYIDFYSSIDDEI